MTSGEFLRRKAVLRYSNTLISNILTLSFPYLLPSGLIRSSNNSNLDYCHIFAWYINILVVKDVSDLFQRSIITYFKYLNTFIAGIYCIMNSGKATKL